MILLDNVKKLLHGYDDETESFYKEPNDINLSLGGVDGCYYLSEIYVD